MQTAIATPTGSEPQPTCKAAGPFDRDDADVILRSSDGVDIYVHRAILSLGSSVFADTFTLPQPQACDTDTQRPVVDVSESGETLDVFLRICYPVVDPCVTSLPLIRQVLDAAKKYDAPAVLAAMKSALVQPRLLRDDPLRVFAIACCCGLEEEAEIAAERAVIDKRVVGQRPFAELDEISAGAYYHLLKLNRTRTECSSMGKASEVNTTVDFTDIEFVPGPSQDVHDDRPVPEVPFACPNADLILRSRDLVDFRVSRSVVALASPILLQNPHEEAQTHDEPLPVYVLPEDSHVLDILLRIIHPTDHSSTLGPNTKLADVLSAARKYVMCKVERTVRDLLPVLLRVDPLRLYLVVAQCGWRVEALRCARELIRQHDIPTIYRLYHPEMESFSSGPYRRLLCYLEACSRTVSPLYPTASLAGRGVPLRSCARAALCNALYPTQGDVIRSISPSRFSGLMDAVKRQPCGSVLAPDTPVAQSFLSQEIDSVPACRQTKTTNHSPGKACNPSDNLKWGLAFLDVYAKEVDSAVNKVVLEFDEAQLSPS